MEKKRRVKSEGEARKEGEAQNQVRYREANDCGARMWLYAGCIGEVVPCPGRMQLALQKNSGISLLVLEKSSIGKE
jgi:hypothetical protein